MHIRQAIKDLRPYKPGRPLRDLEQLGIEEGIKLGSNENPLGPSPQVLEAMRRALSNARLYPEPGAPVLREALAAHYGVAPERVIAGAGIDDLIDLTVRVMLDPGDDLVLADPGFVRYAVAAGCADGRAQAVPGRSDRPFEHHLDAMLEAVGPRTRIVALVNPNNPTGSFFTAGQLDAFLSRVPEGVLTILDEAYFEFAYDSAYPNGLDYLDRGKSVLVFRTFSKCHALAGLRVGFGVGPADLIGYLDRARLPFNINVVAEAAALAALEDTDYIERTRQLARSETAFLAAGLKEQGWEVHPTQTNFVFCKAPVDGERLAQSLLRQGIILRPLTAFGLPAEYFRVSHGTREQNRRFLAAAAQAVAA